MKLKTILEQIIKEIGEAGKVPPDAKFTIGEHDGTVHFTFMEDKYEIQIRFPIKQDNSVVMTTDFYTEANKENMTNKNQALKVMSYVVGCIEEWLIRYKKKFLKGQELQVIYIKYNPKSEEGESSTESGMNARDRIYRVYLEKFAKRYGSNVSFSTGNGTVAKFDPKLTI